VAQLLNEAKLATLLIDLLTANEEAIDLHTAHLRFDIELLARGWSAPRTGSLSAQTRVTFRLAALAPALVLPPLWSAATRRPDVIGAIVSRGGRPDLAGPALPRVRAPTLLIVGGNDVQVIELNRIALPQLGEREAACDGPGSDAPLRRTWSA